MINKLRASVWNIFSKYVRIAVFEYLYELAIEEIRNERAKPGSSRKNKKTGNIHGRK
jgi:hypothetical protein